MCSIINLLMMTRGYNGIKSLEKKKIYQNKCVGKSYLLIITMGFKE